MEIGRIHMLESINEGTVVPTYPGYLVYIRYNSLTVWAILTMYTSKCAQMDPKEKQGPYRSKFYSRCKKCDIEQTIWGGYHTTPLVVSRLIRSYQGSYVIDLPMNTHVHLNQN